jgi:O-antigen/teichoic acid export membrane protein
MAFKISPYSLAWRYDRHTARRYLHFSAPIFLAAICGLLIRQGQTLAFETKLGLAGAGYLTLAITLTRYADRADQMITQTIYPAICAITDKPARLAEVFEKSNRLTAMWALPFGAGLALFADDLVHFVLGDKWRPAIALIQIMGVSTAIYQLGFNWTAFYRALGKTRPQTVYAIAGLVVFAAVPIPLLFTHGATAFAWGLFAVNLVAGFLRWIYMRQLLPGVKIARFVFRSLIPPLVAATPILLWRNQASPDVRIGAFFLQLLLFAATYLLCTAAMERVLLREAVGYLRNRSVPDGPPTSTPAEGM